MAEAKQILGSDPREERRAELSARYAIATTADNTEVARESDILILAVKPQVMARVLDEIQPHVKPTVSEAEARREQTAEWVIQLNHEAKIWTCSF